MKLMNEKKSGDDMVQVQRNMLKYAVAPIVYVSMLLLNALNILNTKEIDTYYREISVATINNIDITTTIHRFYFVYILLIPLCISGLFLLFSYAKVI